MGINRYAARRDKNEPEIVKALRNMGASVCKVSGEGITDLVCGFRGVTYLAEVKSKSGKLTPAQIAFREGWHGDTIYLLRSVDDAIAMLDSVKQSKIVGT